MQTRLRFGIFVVGFCALQVSSGSAQHRTLFSFKAPLGAQPSGLVRASDGVLYGSTREGGAYGRGAVLTFVDPAAPQVLHAFTGQTDGGGPSALVDGGDFLYGLSSLPSVVNAPERVALFRLDHAGNFQLLESIPGYSDSVVLVRGNNGRVYGATTEGRVFCVDATGALTTIYTFAAGTYANSLTADAAGVLYGTTLTDTGRPSQLFAISTGGELKVLASLAGATETSSAESPAAVAVDAAGTVYVGVRKDETGVVYRYRAESPLVQLAVLEAAPTLLVSGLADGVEGTTAYGGTAFRGSVFKIASNGIVTTLHSFVGTDGAAPNALAVDGETVYGTAADGGGNGSVFRVTSGQEFSTLYAFNYPDGVGPTALVRAADGTLYGTTQDGGPNSVGTVFKADATGQLETLHAFTPSEGANPLTLTLGRDGKLYGRTLAGGATDNGTIFSITTAGEFAVLASFSDYNQSSGPALVQTADGSLYGADQAGSGHLFRVATDASAPLEIVYTFPGLETRDGGSPSALIEGADGALYGTTLGAYGPLIPPSYSSGTVFRLAADGTFSTLYAFNDDDNALGASPRSVVFGKDGQLYGTSSNLTFVCGTYGGLWKLDPSTSAIQQVYAFTGQEDGTGPSHLLETEAGTFYGLTFGGVGPRAGDESSCGVRNSTLFEYAAGKLTTLDALPYVIAASLNSNDLGRAATLIDGADGLLYGVIANGGAANAGELFAFDLTPAAPE